MTPEQKIKHMLIGLGQFDTIAEVRHGHDDLGGEVLANAHMLAASKEMYAALRALAAGDIDVSGTALIYDADPRKLLSAAREALRSAEGWS